MTSLPTRRPVGRKPNRGSLHSGPTSTASSPTPSSTTGRSAGPGPAPACEQDQPARHAILQVPILVMAGDLNTDHPPTAARTVASRYPNATFVTIPRGGSPASTGAACAARIAAHFMNIATAGNTRCAPNEGKDVLGIGYFPARLSRRTSASPASGSDRSTRETVAWLGRGLHRVDAVLQAFGAGADWDPPCAAVVQYVYRRRRSHYQPPDARFVRTSW